MRNKSEEKQISEILGFGTPMKASSDLSARILDSWRKESTLSVVYAPIIPKWFWGALGVFIISIFIWGFSQMTWVEEGSILSSVLNETFQKLEYAQLGFEGIVFSIAIVLLLLIFLNSLAQTFYQNRWIRFIVKGNVL